MTLVAISLAVEGPLDEQVLRRLIRQAGPTFAPGPCYGKMGRDDLRINVSRFNLAAPYKPFVILADLERDDCAPELLHEWLPGGAHPNLILRVAVHMVESWLLADRAAFASFLGVSRDLLPVQPDREIDAKLLTVRLARRSRKRMIRADLVPAKQSTSRVGKNYVGRLTEFVQTGWQIEQARQHSPSLDRAVRALERFRPVEQ